MKPPTSQIPQEDEPPKRGLARAWEVVKMLYENDVTRQVREGNQSYINLLISVGV
jgi:hypothetical protein